VKGAARRLAASLALALAAAPAWAQAPPAPGLSYDVRFEVRIVPSEKSAHVALHLADPSRAVYRLRFRTDPERQVAFRGDGPIATVQEDGADLVTWTPPRGGGALRWTVRVDHLRDESSYDARIARDWALVRADDLVPPVTAVTEKGSQSRARLQMVLPQGWSAVVPYAASPDGTWSVDRPERRFDRPVGWLLMGRLGVLRERVAGVRVAIAAPVGHGMRREDLLALLRWTLPALRKIAPLPERLAIVGAADPMWRGGLSGPNSIYLHPDLPLVEANATSPLLHEVMHAVLRARAGPNGDWIVEGLAELYSQELLARSKTISRRRAERGAARLAEKGRSAGDLGAARADAAVAARAATLLRELDAELRGATGGQKGLDDVVRALAEAPRPISFAHFREVAERVAGQKLAFFDRPALAALSGGAAEPR
jgi:hypothetical protein